MAMPTLMDVIRRNGSDAAVGLIDETTKAVPEVRLGTARTIAGLNYKTRVRTGLPTVGFRQVNAGTAVTKSTTEQRLIECYLMNPQFEVDQAAADAAEDGAAAYLAEEANAIMLGAMQSLGTAFFYGADATFGKADAFPGLLQCYDSTNMRVDAGGATASVNSSVWAVRWGVGDVNWVLGQGGAASITSPEKVRLVDGSGNPYTGYRQELYLRPGLQVGSIYSVARIAELTLLVTLTDKMIDDLVSRFLPGRPPTAIYMTRRSRMQWKNNRTATSPTGAPAPWPDIVDGPEGPIPVYITDSLSNIEEQTT